MKSKKKLLLLGVGAMGALAMGVGATSTFAWYEATMTASATMGTRSDDITVTKGVAAGVQIALNFTIGIADDNGLELSNSEGDAKYVVNNTLYPSSTNDTVGQYAIKVSASAPDLLLWKNALAGNGKTSADVAVTLTGVYDAAEANPSDIQSVLLKANSTKGSDTNKSNDNQHALTIHFDGNSTLSITSINGAAAAATTKFNGSADATAFTSANALFALRPRYQATTTNFDTATNYTDTTNAKYFVIAVGNVTENA